MSESNQSAAERQQPGRVALVTKKAAMESNTNQAQGGIAAVFDGNDSFDLHIQDTLASGAGLCQPGVVKLVVKEVPRRIEGLVGRGVSFSRQGHAPSEAFDLGREGGHSRNRIVHTQDMTGREVERALLEQVRAHPNIELFENHIAIDLITHSIRMKRGQVTTTHEEHCCGAYVLDREARRVRPFLARVVLLATGGAAVVHPWIETWSAAQPTIVINEFLASNDTVTGLPDQIDTCPLIHRRAGQPGNLFDAPTIADLAVIVEDLIKLLDGLSNSYRRGRHPDKRASAKVATLLRAVADDLEL